MKTKDVLLASFIIVGLVACVKAAQVALTPEFWDWLATASFALVASDAMKFLTAVAVVLWCLACIAMAWERAEERYRERVESDRARRAAERLERESHARSLRVRQEIEEATRNDRGQSAA